MKRNSRMLSRPGETGGGASGEGGRKWWGTVRCVVRDDRSDKIDTTLVPVPPSAIPPAVIPVAVGPLAVIPPAVIPPAVVDKTTCIAPLSPADPLPGWRVLWWPWTPSRALCGCWWGAATTTRAASTEPHRSANFLSTQVSLSLGNTGQPLPALLSLLHGIRQASRQACRLSGV